jgi:ABC-type Fe3+ transport system permease subunit
MRMRKFLRSKTAAGGVIVTLISMMVMLLVGIVIVNALINSQVADDTWSAEANTTWANTQNNIWLAFSLVVIGLIIVGAVAILSYLNFGGTPAA